MRTGKSVKMTTMNAASTPFTWSSVALADKLQKFQKLHTSVQKYQLRPSSTTSSSIPTVKSSVKSAPWTYVNSKLFKRGYRALISDQKAALRKFNQDVDKSVKYLIENNMVTKRAIFQPKSLKSLPSKAKRSRSTSSSDMPKRNRTNDNISSAVVEETIALLAPNVKFAVRETLSTQREPTWAAKIADRIVRPSSNSSNDSVMGRSQTIDFILKIGNLLEKIPEPHEKVSCIVPVFTLLTRLHDANVELDSKVGAMQQSIERLSKKCTSIASGTESSGDIDSFNSAFEEFTSILRSLFNFFTILKSQLQRQQTHCKEIAAKQRFQLYPHMRRHTKLLKSHDNLISKQKLKIQQIDAKIMGGVETTSKHGGFKLGDDVLVKMSLPNVSVTSDTYVAAKVVALTCSTDTLQVKYGEQTSWVSYDAVQLKNSEEGIMRLKTKMISAVQNKEKQALLLERQTIETHCETLQSQASITKVRVSTFPYMYCQFFLNACDQS